MLTGPWGTGKSFFVQNELLPEIKKAKKQCVVVSLYGIRNISEISKSIYFELRIKKISNNSERFAIGMLLAKTVVRGITSFWGIDLKADNNDLQNLYETIDLKDKLIIFEDVERCQIDMVDILGYVNGLVEQDGVKVLLITNEKEFLKYETVECEEYNLYAKKTITVPKRQPTSETKNYLNIKEKTINDTVYFDGDILGAISSIISKFGNTLLDVFNTKDAVDDIYSIMTIYQSYNLRSFVYACQKTVDLYEALPKKYGEDGDFTKSIFYGILSYVLRIKAGKELFWEKETYYSMELGNQTFPLFKFAYDYINTQKIDYSNIGDVFKSYKELQMYDMNKSNHDADIETLSSYCVHTEKEVKHALVRITKRLKEPNNISFFVYGKLAVCLIYIKFYLDFNVEEAKQLLVDNLKGRGDKLRFEQIFRIKMGDDATDKMLEEYNELRKRMGNALKEGICVIPGFNYQPEQVDMLYRHVSENEGRYHLNEAFASDLDMQRLAELFSICSPDQKDTIRHVFIQMYRSVNIGQFLRNDLESIIELKELIVSGLEQCKEDKVHKLQYEFFKDNLTEIIEKLSV